MASLSNAKTLGGVGGILATIPIPGLGIVGWILIILSLKQISDISQDRAIIRDGVIAGVTAIIGAVAVAVFLLSTFLGYVRSSLGVSSSLGPGGLVGATTNLAVFDASAIVSGIFLKRCYDSTTQRLKIGAFATAGLLYLVGAFAGILLLVIFPFSLGISLLFFIGTVLIFFVAFIYQIIAYFRIQDQPRMVPYYVYPQPQPVPVQPPPSTLTQAPAPSVQTPSQLTPTPQPTQASQASQPAPPPVSQPLPSLQTPQPQTTPVQPVAPSFKYCFRCGTKLPYHAVFCSNCGTRQ